MSASLLMVACCCGDGGGDNGHPPGGGPDDPGCTENEGADCTDCGDTITLIYTPSGGVPETHTLTRIDDTCAWAYLFPGTSNGFSVFWECITQTWKASQVIGGSGILYGYKSLGTCPTGGSYTPASPGDTVVVT